MLTAYFDESGHSSLATFVSIAAFVADEADWARFDPVWQAALSTYDVPYLHMREFAHKRRCFAGWAEERRRGLLAACVSAINSVPAVAVGAAISVDDFNKLPDPAKEGFLDPFFCCFQEAVRGAAIRGVFDAPMEKVRMVFSQQDEFRGRAVALWEALSATIDVKHRMDTITFANMRDVPGLQAADLLAYELRHFYHLRATRPDLPPRWPFKTIVTHQWKAYGARMLKFLPSWYLQLQAHGVVEDGMSTLMQDPGTYLPLLLELHPDVG